MSSSRHYFVACSLVLWRDSVTSMNLPLAAKMPDGSIGCLRVYETREEAVAANPTAKIVEIVEAPDPERKTGAAATTKPWTEATDEQPTHPEGMNAE